MLDLSTGYSFYLKLFSKNAQLYIFSCQQNNWKRRAEHENIPVNTLMYVFRNNQNQTGKSDFPDLNRNLLPCLLIKKSYCFVGVLLLLGSESESRNITPLSSFLIFNHAFSWNNPQNLGTFLKTIMVAEFPIKPEHFQFW